MKVGLKKQAYKGFLWQAMGSGAQTFIQIGVLIILARLITPDEFGLAQSALIVVGFANLLGQMGVGPAIVQRKELTENHIRAAFTLSLLLGIVLSLLVYFGSGVISLFFRMPSLTPILKLVSVIFILENVTVVSQSLLHREMRLKSLVLTNFISYTLGYGLIAFILGYYGFGVWALIWAAISQVVVRNFVIHIIKPHSLKLFFGKKEIKELLYFGGGFTLARFFNYIATQGDNIIIGRYLGAGALGIYSRAYAIMVKPVGLLGDSLDKALFPAMAVHQNNHTKLKEVFINGSKLIVFLCIPISVVIITSSKELINVMLGSKWEAVVIPLQILTAGLVFRIGYKMGDILSKATGNVYRRAKRNMLYALCVLVGCYIGSKWGIIGVSFGTLFAIFVNYLLMIHLSLSILKIKWVYFLMQILSNLSIVVFISFLFICIFYLTRYLTHSDILILLISYSTFGVTCLMLFYFFWHKLTFIDILPFNDIIRKFTRKNIKE